MYIITIVVKHLFCMSTCPPNGQVARTCCQLNTRTIAEKYDDIIMIGQSGIHLSLFSKLSHLGILMTKTVTFIYLFCFKYEDFSFGHQKEASTMNTYLRQIILISIISANFT